MHCCEFNRTKDISLHAIKKHVFAFYFVKCSETLKWSPSWEFHSRPASYGMQEKQQPTAGPILCQLYPPDDVHLCEIISFHSLENRFKLKLQTQW
jgi:hypothetical protein